MTAPLSLIAELEDTFKHGSRDKRVECLRRITDLFLTSGNGLGEEQIAVFDDVLCYLTKAIETRALAELSRRLAPVGNAPVELIRRLAWDDDVAVAEPVLMQSARLADADLIEIAQTKSQGHLRAISGRAELDHAVTDVLVGRGDREVLHTLGANTGARFSEEGFAALIKRAESDEKLAEKVGARLDLPWHLLRQLVVMATSTVRSRILSAAPEESRQEIQRVISSASDEVTKDLGTPRNYVKAQRLAIHLKNAGQLNEAAILDFARTIRIEEMVAGLALMCAASIEVVDDVVFSERRDALLVPCKAVGLDWQTVQAIYKARGTRRPISDGDLEQARVDYSKLTQATAQRVLRYWQVRETTSRMQPGSDPEAGTGTEDRPARGRT
jgi:uncharacterized protein (DUF2336 family)